MKINWGFAIALVYILFAGSMIAFAIRASREHDELVSENYYEEAVNYQQIIDAKGNAQSENSKLNIQYLRERNCITISSGKRRIMTDGVLHFYKPDHAHSDFDLTFSMYSDSIINVPLKELRRGTWKIWTTWTESNKNCLSETKIFVP